MRTEETEDRERRRLRLLLIAGITAVVLTLVSLVVAILDPGWQNWLRTAALLATSLSCLLNYRKSRPTR
ncbi:hypothetical protein [Kribbella sp. NPDC051770]|uniref:hypothetical protein n=1 Tax=Kribbella sp. NPDC051770 TaxID=3155413 RepID=UPI0034253AD3